MKKALLWIGLLVFSGTLAWAQTDEPWLKQAREAYDRGEYAAAVKAYQTVIKEGVDSGDVYYNLGNAEFKLGHLGQAIANYRKALKRKPHDEDIRFNLEYARTFIKQPADRKGPLAKWLEFALAYFAPESLALAAMSLFWILAGLVMALIFTRNSMTSLRWVTVGMGLLFIGVATWASIRILVDRNNQWGVIVSARAEARNGPNQEFQVGFVIPEGREVRILGREGEWVAVGLPAEGYKGWIRRDDLSEDE